MSARKMVKKGVNPERDFAKLAKFQNRIDFLDIEKLVARLPFGPQIYGHIYEIHFFKANKIYIGQTSESKEERLKRHESVSRGERSTPLSEAIRDFGFGDDVVRVRILAEAYSFDELDALEIKYINESRESGLESLNPHVKAYKRMDSRVPYFISSTSGFKSMRDIWRGVIRRCYDSRFRQFHHYGGRGIMVCSDWREDFSNFLIDMWPSYKEGMTLDRIDNDGNYAPDNCRWATRREQVNNSSTIREVEINGITYPSIIKACNAFGILYEVVKTRMKKRGMTLVEAISTPLMPRTKSIIVNGIQFESKAKACEYFGVTYTKVKQRLKAGWDIDRAFSSRTLDRSEWKSNNQTVIVHGRRFSSIRECAFFYSLNPTTLTYRLNVLSMSPEEAVKV